MSTSNPIIPPGSPLRRTRSAQDPKVLVTVCAILTVHLVLLAGLLIQGCKREETRVDTPPDFETNTLPRLSEVEPPPGDRLPPIETDPTPSTQPPTPPVLPGTGAMSTGVVAEPGAFSKPGTEPLTPPKVRAQENAAYSPTLEGTAQMTVYVVQAGDTLTKIARLHGTTVNAIRAANGLKTDRILVGQKLKVPAGKQPPVNAAAPK